MNVLRTSFLGAAAVACLAGVASGGPVFTYLTADRGVVASNFYPSWTEHERVPSSTTGFAPYSARVEVSYWGYGDANAEQTSSFESDSMYFSTSLYASGGIGHSTMGVADSFFDVYFEVSEPVEHFHLVGTRGEQWDPFPFESWIRLTDTVSATRLIDRYEGVGRYLFAEASLVPGVQYLLQVSSRCSGITYWNDGWGNDVDTSWARDALTLRVVVPSGPTGLVMVGGLLAMGGRRRTR